VSKTTVPVMQTVRICKSRPPVALIGHINHSGSTTPSSRAMAGDILGFHSQRGI
jgi:hypothetical protein